jgi:ligand-binding sensor domain-containing protein/signal transduction histidine kinase
VQRWRHEDGLPDDSVTCLEQTRDGFLWVGTSRGLARFDGIKFFPLQLPVPGTNIDVEITALFQDSSERLWIGTREDGLWCLADQGLRQVHLDRGLERGTVTCVTEDSSHDLWIGTAKGLYRVSGTNMVLLTEADGLPSDVVSSVHASRSGTVWITTRGGMCQCKNGLLTPLDFQSGSPGHNPEMIGMYEDRRGNLWAFGDTYLVNLKDGKRFNYFRSGDTTSLRIWSFCEGRDGQFWIGTSGQGVFSFAEGRFRPLSLRDEGLGSDVQAILEDRTGGLWLGTFGGGLVELQPRRVQQLTTGSGLPADTATCLAPSPNGQLWVAYANWGLFAKSGEGFSPEGTPNAPEDLNLITSMAATHQGQLWIGTQGLGLKKVEHGIVTRFTTENGLADDEISALAAQSDGSVWIGTVAGTIHHIVGTDIKSYGPEAGLSHEPITCLMAGSSGVLWAGTGSGRLLKLAQASFVSADPMSVLEGAPIRALCNDAAGRLWIGTQGKGLACSSGGQLMTWDMKTGIPDNEVDSILADDYGKLWLGTHKGIYLMTPPAADSNPGMLPGLRLVTDYGRMSSAIFRHGWPQAVTSRDGRLWFVLPNALGVLDPHDFQADLTPLRVNLENILVNGHPLVRGGTFGESGVLRPNRPLRLPSSLRTLEIEFTAPCLASPDRLQFQHRLDPFDGDWVEGGTDRHVRYSGLPFGSYHFRVRAKNLDGIWGPENAGMTFDFPLPLWRSPLILTVDVILGLAAVGGAVRLISHRRLRQRLAQVRQQQALERERLRIARDMHDEIGSKLTRLAYLCEPVPQDELPFKQKLAPIGRTVHELLRNLDEIVWAVNPQNDTLEHLAAYLGFYAAEYLQNTSISCELDIPPDLPVCVLTAETRHNLFLAFEEAVANALKHSKATRLRVEMSVRRGRFEISIQDNGCGFEQRADSGARTASGALRSGRVGNGLVNMQERLASVGGSAGIESAPDAGTTVKLSFPLERKDDDTL